MDGHRADLVILKAARAHAAFEGRTRVTERDILLAAELALPHRLRRGPFSEASLYEGELEERLDQISEDYNEQAVGTDSDVRGQPAEPEKKVRR